MCRCIFGVLDEAAIDHAISRFVQASSDRQEDGAEFAQRSNRCLVQELGRGQWQRLFVVWRRLDSSILCRSSPRRTGLLLGELLLIDTRRQRLG